MPRRGTPFPQVTTLRARPARSGRPQAGWWSRSGWRTWSAGRPAAAEAGRTALVVAGTPQIRAGEQLVFLKVIAAAPAVVRRDGKVQAGGHPADHARLGALEQQLDDLAGPGVIDEIAAQAALSGKVKGKARRSMTAAAAIRATILMALMPDADYAGVLAAVFGDLVLVRWQRPFKVPTPKVLGTWRAALGPAPLARLQALLLAAVGGEHRGHGYRAVHVGELHLGSIDGSVTRVPDTPANLWVPVTVSHGLICGFVGAGA